MRNLAEMFFRTVRTHGERPAVTFKDVTLTWRELFERVEVVRREMARAGVKRGDIVAVHADHNLCQVVSILATVACDAVFQVLNPALRKDQVLHQLSDSNAAAIVGQTTHLAPIVELAEHRDLVRLELDEYGVLDAGSGGGSSAAGAEFPTTRNIPADVSNIIYTSGSTGRSKGVVVPHSVLLDGARIVSGYLGITDQDVILSILPFSFDYGLNQFTSCVYTGARLVLHTFVFPREFVRILRDEKITGVAAVPSLWPNLFNAKLIEQDAAHDIETLRYITTAGGPHGEKLLRDLDAFFPSADIIIMYGLTESFRSTYLPYAEVFDRIGSIGKAVPEVEILVLDEKGEPCAPGERGELVHRGAFITYGYLNQPELTAEKFVTLHTGGPGCRPELAVRSGDVVSLDEDGFIYFHGRKDAQIKSYGYRISPGEVEEAAMSFPGLQHAGAFGVADPTSGQRVCLAYAAYPGVEVDEDRLMTHLRTHLPNYAVPRQLDRHERMPLAPNGKVDYPALVAASRTGETADA